MAESIEQLRLKQMVLKVEAMMQKQQEYFKCNKAQWPEKKQRLLNESKELEGQTRGFIKQLRYEKLVE